MRWYEGKRVFEKTREYYAREEALVIERVEPGGSSCRAVRELVWDFDCSSLMKSQSRVE